MFNSKYYERGIKNILNKRANIIKKLSEVWNLYFNIISILIYVFRQYIVFGM